MSPLSERGRDYCRPFDALALEGDDEACPVDAIEFRARHLGRAMIIARIPRVRTRGGVNDDGERYRAAGRRQQGGGPSPVCRAKVTTGSRCLASNAAGAAPTEHSPESSPLFTAQALPNAVRRGRGRVRGQTRYAQPMRRHALRPPAFGNLVSRFAPRRHRPGLGSLSAGAGRFGRRIGHKRSGRAAGSHLPREFRA